MTDQTKEYDEKAREMAAEIARILGCSNNIDAIEGIFIRLKYAYQDGVLDELRRNV